MQYIIIRSICLVNRFFKVFSKKSSGELISPPLRFLLTTPGAARRSGFLRKGVWGKPLFLLKEGFPPQKPSPRYSTLSKNSFARADFGVEKKISGGEKAFVAITLYFAILKLRPAPFCVLDEIEAALDDVNVQRYAKYIRKLTDFTQFIVITHRRGTMEEADMLYGVTMQEQGVSKLLMLNLAEAEKRLKNTIK